MVFDPAWPLLPDRTPLHAQGVDVPYGTGGIDAATHLGDGFWARSSLSHDGAPQDAPVHAVFWACSTAALQCVLDAGDPPASGAEPPAVLGVEDARFGALRAPEGQSVKAMYRFTDGKTHMFRLHRGGWNTTSGPTPRTTTGRS